MYNDRIKMPSPMDWWGTGTCLVLGELSPSWYHKVRIVAREGGDQIHGSLICCNSLEFQPNLSSRQ